MLDVPIFSDVVNMVSRGVLKRHVGCCNHGATWGVKKPCGIDVTSVILINFILFLFLFYFLKLKYVFRMCMLINDIFSI